MCNMCCVEKINDLSFLLSFFLSVPENQKPFQCKIKARGNSRSAADFIFGWFFPWKRWRRTGERYEDDALYSCRVPGARFPPFPPLPWDAPLPSRAVAPSLQAGRGPQSQQVDRPAAEPAAPPDLGTGRLIFMNIKFFFIANSVFWVFDPPLKRVAYK